uniref:type I restriction endonuclease subunit R, EcoR124 family n=2 Tax=Levilactobacillus brevis TaxID=1580 RepID=UPI0022E185F6
MLELSFEKEVVKTLTTGSNQWVERKDLYGATPDQLWANFRDKLNNNNYAKLQGYPLTDTEFNQVKRAIEVRTPYEAAKLLAAENGIGKVEVERDDAKLGTVTLELFWKADVAGGKSSYEVVRQAVRPRLAGTQDVDPDRRFDVTLLINGLPLIQLELKKATVELNQAFNQIEKYAQEGKYTGIYSLLQMFVIMTPDSTAYFANAEPDHFNKAFLFNWRTRDNHPVENGLAFTRQVLNIPMAHKMVSEYTVIDQERQSLILLRPYQIYAIEAVVHRIHDHQDGFVWHTTGSGKTLTSYKTAKLAAQDPGVDKVIFFVDEAHRSQFGKMQKEIRDAFVNSNWYGYTGTPIFNENKKQLKGDLAVTTEELCHVYNLRDALEDQAVLPFNVEHVTTIGKDTLITRALEKETQRVKARRDKQGRLLSTADEAKIQAKIQAMSVKDLEETYLTPADFETDEHINQVVQYILQKGPRKTSLGHGNYNAILTTSSIEMAQRYYQAFKAAKKTTHNQLDPNWPRIAITYSLSENEDQSAHKHDQMATILKDYNQQYHTNFDLADLKLYNEDVAKRAARREAVFANLKPDQEINLVIVVRRLLTGFDAPRLNTLFVDRPLAYQELIQAYSRTNRLQNRELKQEGQIVTFRVPAIMEANEREAYKLYSGEGSFNVIIRPTYQQAVLKFQKAVVDLKAIAPTPTAADDLKGTTAKVQFVKAFRQVNQQLNSLSMYNDFTWENSERAFGIAQPEVESYTGKYLRIKAAVTNQEPEKVPEELAALDFSLAVGSVVLVDYDYLTQLIQDWIDEQQQYSTPDQAQAHMTDYLQNSAKVQASLNKLAETQPQQAQLIREAMPYIEQQMQQSQQQSTPNQVPVALNARELVADYAQKQLVKKTTTFAHTWGLDQAALLRVAREHTVGTDEWHHEQELTQSANLAAALQAQT